METDLNGLTKEQLIALVQVRGQGLEFNVQADQRLFEKLEAGDVQEGDFEKFAAAKNEILAQLATAEEKILAGQMTSVLN